MLPALHAISRRRVRRSTGASGVERAGRGGRASVGAAHAGRPVAHAAHGLDRAAGDRPQLAPQEVDVRVDDRGRDLGVVRPGVVEQLVAAEHPAAVAEQALEQGELARAEVDPQAVDGDDAGRLVELDRSRAQRRLARRRRARAARAPAPAPRAPRSRTA